MGRPRGVAHPADLRLAGALHLALEQHALRSKTIVIAVILVVIGIAGTFLNMLPNVGGYPGTTVGVAAYVAATVAMLAGIFIHGLWRLRAVRYVHLLSISKSP